MVSRHSAEPFLRQCMLIGSKERILVFWLLYRLKDSRYNIFRTNNRSEGGVTMDLRVVGLRIKEAREAKNLTQEDLGGFQEPEGRFPQPGERKEVCG